MENYHELLAHLVENGMHKPNRTGISTFADVGFALKFDLAQGFPAVTTKKLAFNAVKGELLGFFRGYENAADFRKLGCKVWDQNANETTSWVNNPHRKGTDDLGRIYGVQWTGWRDTRVLRTSNEAYTLMAKGYELVAHDTMRQTWVVQRTLNQLEEALKTLLTDPYNRRIIVSGWRPDEFDQMSLPPCHVAYQWTVMPDGRLDATMWQRSVDTFLGLPFNIASTALFTHIMARLSGYRPGKVTLFLSDAHLYENHVEQAKEQLSRSHLAAPTLELSDRIRKVESVQDVRGAFERIEPEDIKLVGYESHAALKALMAA